MPTHPAPGRDRRAVQDAVERAVGRRPPLDTEAAAYCGITERHMRRLRAERRVAAIKLGGRVLYDPDDLDALLEASKERPA